VSHPGHSRFPTAIVYRIYGLLFRDVPHKRWSRPGFAIHGIFKVIEGTFSLVGRGAISRHVARSPWRWFSNSARPFSLFLRFPFKPGSYTFVPSFHGIIWLIWKALFGQHLGEDVAGHWVSHIVLFHSFLQKRDVVFWPQ
jgi:hypothetical protein